MSTPGIGGVILALIYYCDDPSPLDTVPPPIEKLSGFNCHIDESIRFHKHIQLHDFSKKLE